MKKLLFVPLLLLFTTFSCKKIDELTQFEMDYTVDIEVESSTNINLPFEIITPDVQTNAESTFSANDTRKDLIEEIKLTNLKLTLKSPSGEDFSFLESVEIYLSAEGLSEVKIAWKENINSTTNVLNLDVLGNDIKEYIKKDKFKLRFSAVTDEILTTNHEIEAKSTFFVDAKIIV